MFVYKSELMLTYGQLGPELQLLWNYTKNETVI